MQATAVCTSRLFLIPYLLQHFWTTQHSVTTRHWTEDERAAAFVAIEGTAGRHSWYVRLVCFCLQQVFCFCLLFTVYCLLFTVYCFCLPFLFLFAVSVFVLCFCFQPLPDLTHDHVRQFHGLLSQTDGITRKRELCAEYGLQMVMPGFMRDGIAPSLLLDSGFALTAPDIMHTLKRPLTDICVDMIHACLMYKQNGKKAIFSNRIVAQWRFRPNNGRGALAAFPNVCFCF